MEYAEAQAAAMIQIIMLVSALSAAMITVRVLSLPQYANSWNCRSRINRCGKNYDFIAIIKKNGNLQKILINKCVVNI